jgi:hypothetical protein
MKTCMNIPATSWPTMRIAKATRRARYNPARVFNPGLSLASVGYKHDTKMTGPEVSR